MTLAFWRRRRTFFKKTKQNKGKKTTRTTTKKQNSQARLKTVYGLDQPSAEISEGKTLRNVNKLLVCKERFKEKFNCTSEGTLSVTKPACFGLIH